MARRRTAFQSCVSKCMRSGKKGKKSIGPCAKKCKRGGKRR